MFPQTFVPVADRSKAKGEKKPDHKAKRSIGGMAFDIARVVFEEEHVNTDAATGLTPSNSISKLPISAPIRQSSDDSRAKLALSPPQSDLSGPSGSLRGSGDSSDAQVRI
jgi:hypothetical protein